MKKLLYLATAVIILSASCMMTTSCRYAPSQDNGDTVAASVFEPIDTASINQAKRAKTARKQKAIVDSVGMYYIGSESTKEKIQLVSYPSRRDTMEYYKTRHVTVKGSADIGHVVRVKFYLLNGKDSLVKAVEEVTPGL